MSSKSYWVWLLIGMMVLSGTLHGSVISQPANEDGAIKSQGIVETTSTLASTPWPCYGHDQNNTGQSSYDTSHIDGTVKWNYATGDHANCSFAIDSDGMIYTGSDDNNVYALYPNGTKKWSFTTGGEVKASPALDDNNTLFVGGGMTLYALNASTGEEKWSYSMMSMIYSSPAIGNDGTIYFGEGPGMFPASFLVALYPNNGTKKWDYEIGGNHEYSSPAIGGDGTIYICSSDGNLYAMNPNGTERWHYSFGSFGVSSPSVAPDGSIYAISDDNSLYAIDPDGTLNWTKNIGGYSTIYPAVASDGTIYVGSTDDRLYCLDPDGSENWNYLTGGSIWSSPAIGSDGTVYFGSYDHYIYAVDPNGMLEWKYKTGGKIESSPAIGADGTIYIGSADNNIYAIGASELPSFTLDLKAGGESEGWNFVSFNLIQENESLKNILDDPTNGIDGNYSKVMYYSAGQDKWRTHVPGRPPHFNDLDDWNHSMGLWIQMDMDDSLTVNGTKPTSTDIPLYPGWNMVGYPSKTDRLASDSLPSEVSKIGVFNGSNDYNLHYTSDLSNRTLTAGEGYWIYNSAGQKVDWTVDY